MSHHRLSLFSIAVFSLIVFATSAVGMLSTAEARRIADATPSQTEHAASGDMEASPTPAIGTDAGSVRMTVRPVSQAPRQPIERAPITHRPSAVLDRQRLRVRARPKPSRHPALKAQKKTPVRAARRASVRAARQAPLRRMSKAPVRAR